VSGATRSPGRIHACMHESRALGRLVGCHTRRRCRSGSDGYGGIRRPTYPQGTACSNAKRATRLALHGLGAAALMGESALGTGRLIE